jgi:tetratricopeptide (TPR) repeat protein
MRLRPRAFRNVTLAATLLLLVASVALRLARAESSRVPAMPESSIVPAGAVTTSREGLSDTVVSLTAVLLKDPANSAAAVRLADALLRQARVLNHAGLPQVAETVLNRVLQANPSDYLARRMRATVYLAQHRFVEALSEAKRCRALRSNDPVIDGLIGDASLELGDYPSAFAAFDRMVLTRPDAAAYARVSYAHELRGDVEGAIAFMTMAESATSAHDPEAQAWHASQLGHLHLTAGDVESAGHAYSRAEHLFPGYPLAASGLARVDMAADRPNEALARLTKILETSPAAADFALAGDANARMGRADAANRAYKLAEAMWRSDTPEPAQLARFLATRGWSLDEAVALAEETFAARQDIYTADALAWAYFKRGRLDEAKAAMARALSTGSRDPELLAHARAINTARAR